VERKLYGGLKGGRGGKGLTKSIHSQAKNSRSKEKNRRDGKFKGKSQQMDQREKKIESDLQTKRSKKG